MTIFPTIEIKCRLYERERERERKKRIKTENLKGHPRKNKCHVHNRTCDECKILV